MTYHETTYRVPTDRHPPYYADGRAGTPAKPLHGNTIKEQRPSVTRSRNAAGESVYIAQVREVGGRRTYIGRYGDNENALRACRAYIEDGYLPPDAKRGMPKGGRQTKPRKGAKQAPAVSLRPEKPIPVRNPVYADRLAIIARIAGRFQ